SRWARLRTSRDGNQTSMIPSATPNRARCPTSCAWGSGLISGSSRTAPTTGQQTPLLYICCCSPRTFAGRATRIRCGRSKVRPKGASTGSTITGTATGTASRSTRHAARAAIATRAGATGVPDAGHCLGMGSRDGERGRAAGRRLMQPDMFTGWGLRTLSDHHPSYDPHSCQRGSVWPHDSVIAAAGLRRYGMNEEAWTILDGLLAAVMCFEDSQMPELFAGLPKGEFAVPVPYRMANVPRAWAAGSVLQLVRLRM